MKQAWPFQAVASISIILFGLLSRPATAEPLDLQRLKNYGDTKVREFRQQVLGSLSGKEAFIERSIDYQVPLRWDINGYARIVDGQRKIIVTAGTIAILESITDAMISELALGSRGCLNNYLRYLADGISNNSTEYKTYKPLRPVLMFSGYSATYPSKCRPVTEALLTQNAIQKREGMIEGSLRMLLAHEVGHHVYEHNKSGLSGLRRLSAADLERSRKNEAEADQWAVSKLLDAGVDILSNAPLYMLFAMDGVDSTADERMSTHPAGIRRLLDYVTVIEEGMDGRGPLASYANNANARQAWRAMARDLKKLKDLFSDKQ